MLTFTHKHHITSIQCPSHKCLPEKSCIHCLRILIMSWLFKDPVVIMTEIVSWLFRVQLTVTWLNLTMPNQTVKIGLKAKNIKFRQRIFFSKRGNKIFMHLWAPFILQNFKKILTADPESWECATFRPKTVHLSWKKFFWCKPLSLLSSTYFCFSLCKI